MKPLTKEWVAKAEADYFAGCLLLRSRKAISYDAVCFHGQQCAEKYLKALLQEYVIRFTKTHDLIELCELLSSREPDWLLMIPQFTFLNRGAVAIRYPGMVSTRGAAKDAMKIASTVRDRARTSLGLDSGDQGSTAKRRKRASRRGRSA